MYLKGRVSIIDLFDRPFRELHELYKILYERAVLQQEAEEARRKEEEEKEKKANSNNKRTMLPTDVNNTRQSTQFTPSPLELEALEDAMEELS